MPPKHARKYEPRSYALHGLHGISDRTLAMHFKLYEGYVKETNNLTARIHQLVEDGKSIKKRCRSTRSSNGDTGSNTTAWSCTNTILIIS